jgi:hypothetical protein
MLLITEIKVRQIAEEYPDMITKKYSRIKKNLPGKSALNNTDFRQIENETNQINYCNIGPFYNGK